MHMAKAPECVTVYADSQGTSSLRLKLWRYSFSKTLLGIVFFKFIPSGECRSQRRGFSSGTVRSAPSLPGKFDFSEQEKITSYF